MPGYTVKQYFSSFSSCTDEERENPKECLVNDLNDIKDIDWVKKHTEDKDFFRLSASPFVTKNKIEQFYLMSEEKEGSTWAIVARVICSKEEALKVFPEFVRKVKPFYSSDQDSDIIDVEAKIVDMEEKRAKAISNTTNDLLSFIGKQ